MEFSDEMIEDLTKINFIPGNLNTSFKYKAFIPKDIWNKYRKDKPLINKKYKEVNFGKPGYYHYKDLIGNWKQWDHGDKKRKSNYRARHSKIMINIDGKDYESYLVPFTSEFFSYWFLW
jgi:hypothetical protein